MQGYPRMSDNDASKVESENTGKAWSYMYIAINIALIGLLLIYTELFIGETVMNMMLLLGLSIAIAFFPLINAFFNVTSLISQGATLLTLIMCFVLYYLRVRLILFSVENPNFLTKEDGKAILGSMSPNGVVLILNSTVSEIEPILTEASTELDGDKAVVDDFASIHVPGPIKIEIPTELESNNISKIYKRLRLSKPNKIYVSSIEFKNQNDTSKYAQILGTINSKKINNPEETK